MKRPKTFIVLESKDRKENGILNIVKAHFDTSVCLLNTSNIDMGLSAIKKLKPDIVFTDIETITDHGDKLLKLQKKYNFEVILFIEKQSFKLVIESNTSSGFIVREVEYQNFLL